MNNLPTKFLQADSSLKKMTFDLLEVGKQYYFEQVVIEYHCLYDYLLQVVSKTDEVIECKEIYVRLSDNCIYPGDWLTAEGDIVKFSKKEVEAGFTDREFRINFYKETS